MLFLTVYNKSDDVLGNPYRLISERHESEMREIAIVGENSVIQFKNKQPKMRIVTRLPEASCSSFPIGNILRIERHCRFAASIFGP